MAHLRILGPEERRLPLEGESVVVGRAAHVDLPLPDRNASATHCRIDRTHEGHRILDLESQNGTWVNGKKIRQQVLQPGDVICVGRTELRFEVENPRRPRRNGAVGRALRDLEASLVKYLRVATPEDREDAGARLRARADEMAGALLLPETDRWRRLAAWPRRVAGTEDGARLLASMLDTVVELTGAERGFLLLQEGARARLGPAIRFDPASQRKPSFQVARALAESVAKSAEAIVSRNAADDPRVQPREMSGALRSVACVPLCVGARRVGALYLDHRFESGVFRPQDLPFLIAAADQMALVVEHDRLAKAIARAAKAAPPEAPPAPPEEPEPAPDRGPPRYEYAEMIGNSPAMQDLFHLLDRVIESDAPVFLHGESGVGKELAARAIHQNGTRRAGPFVSLNCAAIPESLFESELFGHARGSFTGAAAAKPGLFQTAHGGTLFLDEIAEMPASVQAKLLRALQEREVRPVGGTRPVPVDTRVITASNKDLAAMVRRGVFRADLYHRIHVLDVPIPPLRRRRADIPPLVDHFVGRCCRRRGCEPYPVTPEAMALLEAYPWPGNVRELENEMERACTLSDGTIAPDTLSARVRAAGARPRTLKEAVEEAARVVEREMITEALRSEGGNKSAVARRLGISRPTLDAKMGKLGIPRHPA